MSDISVVLSRQMEFVQDGNFYYLRIVATSSTVDPAVFLLERSRTVLTSDDDNVPVFPVVDNASASGGVSSNSSYYKPWKWSPMSFLRVCTDSEMVSIGVEDPFLAENYADFIDNDSLETAKTYTHTPVVEGALRLIDPSDNTSPYVGTAVIALYGQQHAPTYSFGYHRYRSNHFQIRVEDVASADRLYRMVSASVAGLIQPVGNVGSDLELHVVGGFTPVVSGVPFSVYPGDQVRVIASGGTGRYTYSFETPTASTTCAMDQDVITFGSVVTENPNGTWSPQLSAEHYDANTTTTVTVTDSQGATNSLTFRIVSPELFTDDSFKKVVAVPDSYYETVRSSDLTTEETNSFLGDVQSQHLGQGNQTQKPS